MGGGQLFFQFFQIYHCDRIYGLSDPGYGLSDPGYGFSDSKYGVRSVFPLGKQKLQLCINLNDQFSMILNETRDNLRNLY